MADSVAHTPSSLMRLSDADYEVAHDEPDIRGWDVVVGADDVIGEVDDLIIDPAAGKVRYIEVDLDNDALQLENDRHVVVPIANAQLDVEDKQVRLGGMTRDAIVRLPEYDAQSFTTGYDDTYRSHISRDTAVADRERDTYRERDMNRERDTNLERDTKRMTRSAEELRIGKRMEKAGEVRVSKHVETERVSQKVPLTREEVHVERRPVEHAVGAAGELRSDEIAIPVMEEQAVIEKRPVVKEEIVISKAPVTREETVEADVRREEIDVQQPSRDGRRDQNDIIKGRGGK